MLATGKKNILFIDTGGNCRCPMAAGYFLKLLENRGIKHIEIRTAGVMTPSGLLPTPEAVLLLHEEGVDIRRHRSRPLTPDLITRADLILGMTPFHVQSAYRIDEGARGKTYLLKEYVGREGRNTQIADPMGGTLEIFKKCYTEIRLSLQRLIEMEFVISPPEASEAAPEEVAAALTEAETEEEKKPKASKEKATEKKEPKKPKAKSPVVKKAPVKAKAKPPKAKKASAAKAKAPKSKKAPSKPKSAKKKAAAKPTKKAAPKSAPKKAKKSPARKGKK